MEQKTGGLMVNNSDLVGGWATPLKNMKVNWDDQQPNINGKIKHVPNHQPVIVDGNF